MFGQYQGRNVRIQVILEDLAADKIETVDISKTMLSKTQLQTLCHAMQINGKVQKINLSGCGVDDEGAEIIAAFLRENKTVIELDLSKNIISTEGFVAIAEALTSPEVFKKHQRIYQLIHPELIALTLRHDDNQNPKIRANHTAHHNATLQSLDLDENQIKNGALTDLQRLMLGNDSLTTLSLAGNPMNNETKLLATQCRKYNDNIKSLIIDEEVVKRFSMDRSAHRR